MAARPRELAVLEPLVIVGRSRSGTRVLAELLSRSGVFMGADVDPSTLDSLPWYQQFVVPLLLCKGSPLRADPALRAEWERFAEERLRDTLRRHLPNDPVSPWGWKYPETLFLMPFLRSRLRGATFVHLIRDGRDVALSNRGYFHLTYFSLGNPPGWRPPSLPERLSAGEAPSFRAFCLAVTFGDPLLRSWRGIDLADPAQLAQHKFLIQMQSWKHSLLRARSDAKALNGRYREVLYENLCADPLGESARLLEWLRVEPRPGVRSWLRESIRTDAIARWRSYPFTPAERRDFAAACELGSQELADLGYAHV